MEAKFHFDQVDILKMIENSLRRQFPQEIVGFSGYIEDGAASVTVKFADGDERFLPPAQVQPA